MNCSSGPSSVRPPTSVIAKKEYMRTRGSTLWMRCFTSSGKASPVTSTTFTVAKFSGWASISGSSMRPTVGTIPITVIFSSRTRAAACAGSNRGITTNVEPCNSMFAMRAKPVRCASGVVTSWRSAADTPYWTMLR